MMEDLNQMSEDIEDAVRVAREALEKTLPGTDSYGMALHHLGTRLSIKHAKTKILADLDEAIMYHRLSVDAVIEEDPARSIWVVDLVEALRARHAETRNSADLLEILRREPNFNNDTLKDGFEYLFKRLLGDVANPQDDAELDLSISHYNRVVHAMPPDDAQLPAAALHLGMLLGTRHERTRSADDLNNAIANMELARAATSVDFPDSSAIMKSLGLLLTERANEERRDLGYASDMLSRATAATPELDPSLGECWARLGVKHKSRYNATDNRDDLNAAIEAVSRAINATPGNHVRYTNYSIDLAKMLLIRFTQTNSLEDLDIAIATLTTAVEFEPRGSPRQIEAYSFLVAFYVTRLHETLELDGLDEAIDVANQAVEVMTPEDSRLVMQLGRLGHLCHWRFDRDGSLEDLERAFAAFTRGLEIHPSKDETYTKLLEHMNKVYRSRYDAYGQADDVLGAIEVGTRLVAATPSNHPSRAERLNSLGTIHLFMVDFITTDHQKNLNLSIELTDQSIKAAPHDHPQLATFLANHAEALSSRFDFSSDMDDLNLAVDYSTRALDKLQEAQGTAECAEYALQLGKLSNLLTTRSQQTGSQDDLRAGIDTAARACSIMSPRDQKSNPSDRASVFRALGLALFEKFNSTGSSDDLNQAVDAMTRAADASVPGRPVHLSHLQNLGAVLNARFQRAGSTDDLNRSIKLTMEGLEIAPRTSPDRMRLQLGLATRLRNRYIISGATEDLIHAMGILQEGLNLPSPDAFRAALLSQLATCLLTRQHGNDLNDALELSTEALELTPSHLRCHLDFASRLADHHLLRSRSNRQQQCDHTSRPSPDKDLDKAIELRTNVSHDVFIYQEDQAKNLSSQGALFWERYQLFASDQDRDLALAACRQGLACQLVPLSVRIDLLEQIAEIMASLDRWQESNEHFREAVRLLPMLSPRFLKHGDKQVRLADSSNLATRAAATALQANILEPSSSLQLLELGRGLIAGSLLDMRTDISELEAIRPDLAGSFASLRSELDLPEGEVAPGLGAKAGKFLLWERKARRRHEIDQEFDQLVSNIRDLPGFSNFLLPPTTEDLMKASDPDPIIVINISQYRCDAWIITESGITLVPLPDLSLEDIKSHARYLNANLVHSDLLQWLWDSTCCPCLNALGYTKPCPDGAEWPRVWWVPTGILASFPLHAAQSFRLGETGASVLDRTMSSYASSVKSLLYGRRRRLASTGPSTDDAAGSILLVSMPKTPSSSGPIKDLQHAQKEINTVKELAKDLNLNLIEPTQACRSEVLAGMQDCRMFHFAGHGRSHQNPSQSLLLLEDWETEKLTVGHVFASKLRDNDRVDSHFLAYLSACSTASNRDEKLSDEGLHLVSAFQLAGFRHVVGTLWEVSDRHCVDVARNLYQTLKREKMTDRAVCLGLHTGIRALRDNGRNLNGEAGLRDASWGGEPIVGDLSWVPYIHFGV